MPTCDCETRATATPTSRTWTETARDLGETASDVFVYFKHEDEGKGAAFGQQMMTLLNQS